MFSRVENLISILKMYSFILNIPIRHSYPILSRVPTLVVHTAAHGMRPSGLILVTILLMRTVTSCMGCTIPTVEAINNPFTPRRVWSVGVVVTS